MVDFVPYDSLSIGDSVAMSSCVFVANGSRGRFRSLNAVIDVFGEGPIQTDSMAKSRRRAHGGVLENTRDSRARTALVRRKDLSASVLERNNVRIEQAVPM